MATGYAALVGLLVSIGFLTRFWGALAAVGRLALTNYLVQSIICTLFFTGFGGGYFGRLQQVELYYIVLEICMVQTIFSVLWLRHYQLGPAEWLWRCLVYKKWLPNRIRRSEPAAPVTPAIS